MDFYKRLFSFWLLFLVFPGPSQVWSKDPMGSTPSKNEGAEIFTKSYQMKEIHKIASLVPKPLSLAKASKEDGKNANLGALKFKDIHKPMGGIMERANTHSSGLMSGIYLESAEQASRVEDKLLKLGKVENPITHKRHGVLLNFTIAKF